MGTADFWCLLREKSQNKGPFHSLWTLSRCILYVSRAVQVPVPVDMFHDTVCLSVRTEVRRVQGTKHG
jgi:hypothetical protein